MNLRLKPTLIASSVFLAIMSQQAMATNGYAAHGFGLTSKAMGGTAVAGHDNAMNMATNPASMSFGKNNWTVGLDLFKPSRSSNHQGNPGLPAAQDPLGFGGFGPVAAEDLDGNDDKLFPVPEFAYQKHLNDKYAVGVAVYGNGGMNATYDKPIFGGPNNSGIDLAQLFIAPSASMKINENHSVGASLNLAYQRISINGVGGFAPFSRDPSHLTSQDYDSSTGAGLSLGWQGQVSPKLKLGLAYKSKTKMSKFDKYKGLLAEQGRFDIPSMITAGLSFQATSKTTLAIDVARINYTESKSVSNKNNTAALQGALVQGLLGGSTPQQAAAALQTGSNPLLGDDNGAGFGWGDQNVVKIGVKHQLNSKVALLGGWNHGKAPIGEDQTAFNVLAPATVEDHLTLGVDWKLTPKSSVTVSYMHAFENEIKGDSTFVNVGQPNQAPASPGAFIPVGTSGHPNSAAPANIKMSQDSIGIAYTRNF